MKINIGIIDEEISYSIYENIKIYKYFITDNHVLDGPYINYISQNLNHTENHADKCMKIITKYANTKDEICLHNIVVKNSDLGNINDFVYALKFIPNLSLDFLCMSIGTTQKMCLFKMYRYIIKIAKSGTIIVAAKANSNKKTYPACFKNVISCCASRESSHLVEKSNGDYILNGVHLIRDKDRKLYFTSNSNSFATAYMVALLVIKSPIIEKLGIRKLKYKLNRKEK